MFITFEGIEGSGKSTQIRHIGERLKKEGFTVITSVEPGGTVIGEKIREILLNINLKSMTALTELLLYNASRAQHLEELIFPAVREKKVVLVDRFSDSTIAYQGYGRGIDFDIIKKLDKVATGGIKPDLTILFDLDVKEGLQRNRRINKLDRLEMEEIKFHERVRKGFIKLSENEPERFRLIDASLPIVSVTETVIATLLEKLKCH